MGDKVSESDNLDAHRNIRPRRMTADALLPESAGFTKYTQDTKAKLAKEEHHKLDIMFLNLYG